MKKKPKSYLRELIKLAKESGKPLDPSEIQQFREHNVKSEEVPMHMLTSERLRVFFRSFLQENT